VADGAPKIGPIFGWVNGKTKDSKNIVVDINAGNMLNGSITISFLKKNENDKNPTIQIKGSFKGILSGDTEIPVDATVGPDHNVSQ